MPAVLRRLARALPDPVRRRVATTFGRAQAPSPPAEPRWADGAPSPWAPVTTAEATAAAWCNICRWTGTGFDGPAHCEGALCPRCGSIARDRFLFWCFTRRTPLRRGLRVLETSPRLGAEYRRAMGTWFDYRSSDYDGRAHTASLRLDLQSIDLPDASIDVLLTPHVLEHVPDTDRALEEICRVLAPKGRMYLQVPVLQGRTARPESPEFHGDETPVFWRFGYDLTPRLRGHGFTATALVPAAWADLVRGGAERWDGETSPEFDVASMLAGSIAEDLTVVADEQDATRIGAQPAYMHITWEAVKIT
ncbi:MAG: methyltransferase domain-containing protein [Acidimicrobiia bacterium]|nr:methyltransferase domain-containing protein [Acidimicrobiia bacterium]